MSDNERHATPGFLDASVIIRYLMRDIPERIESVRQIVEEHPSLIVTDGALAECGHVLTRIYGLPRDAVVDSLIDLVQRQNVHVHTIDTDIAIQALLLCRPSGRVSFADAMLWATARSASATATIYTLDRRFPSIGVTLRDER